MAGCTCENIEIPSRERFLAAVARAERTRSLDEPPRGDEAVASHKRIGTLREKLLHRTLKFYFEPDERRHEVELLGYVADILGEDGVVEIQTRGFRSLREKLDAYLPQYPVTLIYPVVTERRVIWIDPDSGEAAESGKSPKRGRPSDLLHELASIPTHLPSERFRIRLALLRADEYRLADGRGPNGRRGATKMDIYPTELLGLIEISSTEELGGLLPELPDAFSAKQFCAATRLRGIRASVALSYAVRVGLLERVGKRGNAYLYSKKQSKIQ